jgi:hypothetical protein
MSVKSFLYVLTVGACLLTACKTCDPFIIQYELKGRIVYVQAYMGPACTTMSVFYNSSGERFELPSRITFNDFYAESTFIKDVWSCEEGQAGHQ